jgi:hypothetical protein
VEIGKLDFEAQEPGARARRGAIRLSEWLKNLPPANR